MQTTKLSPSSQRAHGRRSLWGWLDDYAGRGSFNRFRRFLHPGYEYCQFTYARTLDTYLLPGMNWLDAGCGHQILEDRHIDQELALIGRASLAAGCDAYLPALAKHRSLDKLVCCSLDRLPFKDDSLDLVTANMVMEHLNQPEAGFAELGRIVKNDGRVIMLTPNVASYHLLLVRAGWRFVPRRWAYRLIRFLEHREPEDVFPTHYKANTVRRIRLMMREAGFVEEEVVLIREKPFFYFFLPASAVEMAFARALWKIGCKQTVAAVVLGVYRRVR